MILLQSCADFEEDVPILQNRYGHLESDDQTKEVCDNSSEIGVQRRSLTSDQALASEPSSRLVTVQCRTGRQVPRSAAGHPSGDMAVEGSHEEVACTQQHPSQHISTMCERSQHWDT